MTVCILMSSIIPVTRSPDLDPLNCFSRGASIGKFLLQPRRFVLLKHRVVEVEFPSRTDHLNASRHPLDLLIAWELLLHPPDNELLLLLHQLHVVLPFPCSLPLSMHMGAHLYESEPRNSCTGFGQKALIITF